MHARLLVISSLASLLAAGCTDESAVDRGLKDFQGTWSVVSMEMDGKFLPEEKIKSTRLKINGEHFTFDTANGSHEGLYKIDPSTNPKQLNIEVTSGEEAGKVYLVIYKFSNGRMIQCMQVDNKQRPSQFTGRAGSGNLYEIWQRHRK